MKILFVVFNYYPSVGGTQIFFQKIAETFSNCYHDQVEVFTTNSYYGPNKTLFKKIKYKTEIINGVKVVRFPFRRWHKKPFILIKKILGRVLNIQSGFINQRLAGPWSSRLSKAIANTDADVIIAASASFMYMKYPLYRHKLKHPKPFIFQGAFHFSNGSMPGFFSSAIHKAMKKSEIYWSNTLFETDIISNIGISRKKIKIVGTGVDAEKFKIADPSCFKNKFHIKENEIIIVCLGRIDAFKGIDVFMLSLAELYKISQNFRAIIAGNNTGYLNSLKEINSGFPVGLRDKILFLENISEEEKIRLCAAMDILVLPSVNESFGMVFLEAWACRKPVIGANIGAVASVISDGIDGLLFEPGNPESLSLQVLRLMTDKGLRENMGLHGYEKVITNYTWQKVAALCRQTCFGAIEEFKKDSGN